MGHFRQVILVTVLSGAAGAAQADLRICNETEFEQSVSIGYQDADDWKSEGWWNLAPLGCATVIAGDLQKRYYYYRAEVNGGDFPGEGYMFCTTPEVYEIIGDTDCEARGYDSESFREIDTGETATDFTFTMVGEGAPPPRTETPPGTESGLTFCNDTGEVQSVSIGYEGDEGFLSEGWWNIQPNECALVLTGPLLRRYYYWRAEVDAADFPGGEGYMFCTDPQVYTIVGDTSCEARGYDSESFAEIDVGVGTEGYTFRIGGVNAPPPVSPPPTGDAGLEVCNQTADEQSVSFGYEGPAGWTSEGWWNLDPGACVRPALDGANRRYIYYRAEVDAGDFAGDGYYFCTTPDAYKIEGDSQCEARGYDREDFREVDTGDTISTYVLTLVDDNGGPAVSPPSYPSEPDLPQSKGN